MNKLSFAELLFGLFLLCSCASRMGENPSSENQLPDSLSKQDVTEQKVKKITSDEITISKELLYDQYTLEDSYSYKDTTRYFQWEKIKEKLALLENIQRTPQKWAILQNYKNRNREAPLVKNFHRDAYKRVTDEFNIERYHSIPLYLPTDTLSPERYAQDGELTRFLGSEGSFMKMDPIYTGSTWMIPGRYVKFIPDSIVFNRAVFLDRHNQNIATLERAEKGRWLIRSMNPSTTGLHRPPYAQETPLGIFVLQEKKIKMQYLKDGTQEIQGYAPYANRFTGGAYIHGVPVKAPRERNIEYSPSLGTTPRSHMCVRNATSHAKFLFEWGPVNQTIIFVLE